MTSKQPACRNHDNLNSREFGSPLRQSSRSTLMKETKNRVKVCARKCHTLYLAGQFAFQNIFMDASHFDGRSSSRISLKSLGVIDALNMRKRPTGELTAYERHSVESGLSPGTLKALSLGLLTWDSLDNCYGLPYAKFHVRDSILQLCRTCQCWNDRDGQGVLNSLNDLLMTKSSFLAYDKNGEFSKALGAHYIIRNSDGHG